MKNIIFIGMPAVGKSTVGVVVAKRLGYEFIDTDLLIQKHYKEIGTIVYLHASFEVINSRLKNAKKRGVALRDGQTLKDLYDERVVLFEKYADITVSEDGLELEETIENVMEVLENQ